MLRTLILLVLMTGTPAASAAPPNLLTEGDPGGGLGGQEAGEALAHYRRGEEGWYWYADAEDEKAPEVVEERPPLPATPAPVEAGPEETKPAAAPPFSAAWLRAKLPELRERAIDNPTRENIQAYLYAQRVMMDKADVFTDRWQQVVTTDPLLDENNRFPFATAFRSPFLQARDRDRAAALRDLAGRAGLFYFFSAKCAFCRQQVQWLERMRADYGFVVKYISIDGSRLPGVVNSAVDQGLAKTLKISVVPAIVLAHPPKTYIVVSQGLLARTALENRIFVAAESEGLIPRGLLLAARPERRGVIGPEDLADGAAQIGDDPKALVDYVRKAIGASE